MGIIAIDFNGTIEDSQNVPKGKKWGPPQTGAEEVIEDLIQEGWRVIIFTTVASNPSGKQAVEDWFEYFDIPYTEVTAVKPNADIYIDNKGLQHTSWRSTIKQINQRLGLDIDEVA